MDLTKAALKKMCRDSGLYSSPALNDKLYLHYKGIRQIQNLEEYTGLRVLWLEGNGLCKLEGMEAQTQMKTLYAHENLIEKIEGLNSFLELDTLNLSKNFVRRVENIGHLGRLTTLLLANNHLETSDDVRQVLQCPSIQTLDLQHNRINDVDVVDVVSAMHDLRVLYLQGNPVVKHIRHYRKTLVSKCATLKYLDDRPVFDEERSRCEAWSKGMAEGGISRAQEAEREEMARIRESKRAAEQRQYLAFEQMMREGLEARQRAKLQSEGANANDGRQFENSPQLKAGTSVAVVPPEPSAQGDQVSYTSPAQGQETMPGDRTTKRCENSSTGSAGREETPDPYAAPPLPPPPPAQMHNPAQERTLVSNSSEENPTLSAPSVNEFSGEAIIPFNDCETVRNARQRRVARILSTSAPAHRGSPADATEPPPQQRADGLPMEEEPLDENDLDLEQLSKGVDEEIRAFEAKSNRLREERIMHNTPPPPPPSTEQGAIPKVAWNNGVKMAANQDVAGAHLESATETNFEELD